MVIIICTAIYEITEVNVYIFIYLFLSHIRYFHVHNVDWSEGMRSVGWEGVLGRHDHRHWRGSSHTRKCWSYWFLQLAPPNTFSKKSATHTLEIVEVTNFLQFTPWNSLPERTHHTLSNILNLLYSYNLRYETDCLSRIPCVKTHRKYVSFRKNFCKISFHSSKFRNLSHYYTSVHSFASVNLNLKDDGAIEDPSELLSLTVH